MCIRDRRDGDDQHVELITLLKRREEQRQQDILNLTKFNSSIETFGEHVKTVLSGLPPSMMIQAKSEMFNILTKYELRNAASTPGTDDSTPVYSPASAVSAHDSNIQDFSGTDPVLLENVTNEQYLDFTHYKM